MEEDVFVINEFRPSCCGMPHDECNCGRGRSAPPDRQPSYGGNDMITLNESERADDMLVVPDAMQIAINKRQQELTRNASQFGLMTQADADYMLEQNAKKLRQATAHTDKLNDDDDALNLPTMNWKELQRQQRTEGR